MSLSDSAGLKYKKELLAVFILILCGFYLFYRISFTDREFPSAKKGTLNYQSLAYSENGQLLLKGEWEFYWNKFYFPSDFKSGNEFSLPQREFVDFPRSWKNLNPRGKTERTSFGFATYRLKITGLSRQSRYSLIVPVINSSYTLWINGRRMLNSGMPGNEKKLSTADAHPRTVSFKADNGETSIILHVSNYTHKRGGPTRHLLLGRDEEVASANAVKTILSGMGIITMLIIAAFLLFLDFRYRKYHKEIFSILLLAVLSLRISVSENLLLIQMFPDISWETIYKFKYILTFSIAPLSMLVIAEHFKRENIQVISSLLTSIYLFQSLVILTLPCRIYSFLVFYFDIYQLACFSFCGFILYRAGKKHRALYKLKASEAVLLFIMFINMRLTMEGFFISNEVSLFSFLDALFNDQYQTQASPPVFISLSFIPYFIIFSLYIFIKLDHLIRFLKEKETILPTNHLELFDRFCLTEREIEIVQALINGCSNLEIAEKCFISVGTVKNHLSHIYRKTECSNRNKLVRLFMDNDQL